MTGPLDGVRVLDLSRIMAGPWAGQIFADLGAEVIHIERPVVGDDTRAWGPPYLTESDGSLSGESAYYMCVNRGKRSAVADLASEEGRGFVRSLAAEADIVLENFKAGTLARYGLDYASLREVKPDLIMCSITGFGQTGPRSAKPAYDFMIQAMSGLMSVTGVAEADGGQAVKVGVPVIDLVTGCYAAIAALAALHRRDVTGQGEYIDVAMFDSALALMSNQAMNHLVGGYEPYRHGNRHPNIQPQDSFETLDGEIVIASGSEAGFRRFAGVLERPELGDDPRFATNAARVANLGALSDIIRPILRTRSTAEWLARLDDASVPCGPINSVSQALRDPYVAYRGQVVEIPHPTAGTVPAILAPYRFTNAVLGAGTHPPLLGEHMDEIVADGWLAGREAGASSHMP